MKATFGIWTVSQLDAKTIEIWDDAWNKVVIRGFNCDISIADKHKLMLTVQPGSRKFMLSKVASGIAIDELMPGGNGQVPASGPIGPGGGATYCGPFSSTLGVAGSGGCGSIPGAIQGERVNKCPTCGGTGYLGPH